MNLGMICGALSSTVFLAAGFARVATLLRKRRRCTGSAQGFVTECARIGSGDEEQHCFDVVYTVKGVGYRITQFSTLSPGARGRKFEVRFDPDNPGDGFLPEEESWFVPVTLVLAGLAFPAALLVLRILGYSL